MNSHLVRAEKIADLLDNKFSFAGFKFGLAPIVDAVPVIGDFLAAALAFYLIWIAINMNVPAQIIVRMVLNIIINVLIGLVPIVGEATYIFRKVNLKNAAILRQYVNNSAVR